MKEFKYKDLTFSNLFKTHVIYMSVTSIFFIGVAITFLFFDPVFYIISILCFLVVLTIAIVTTMYIYINIHKFKYYKGKNGYIAGGIKLINKPIFGKEKVMGIITINNVEHEVEVDYIRYAPNSMYFLLNTDKQYNYFILEEDINNPKRVALYKYL